MKITFACIVFNGEYVLKQLIESIYPFAHKIIFVDGVVEYWNKQGFNGSVDNTVNIIKSFPDPLNKIILHEKIVRKEKTELCQVYMPDVPIDTDYLWCIDSDEIFKNNDIEKTIEMLKIRKPHSVGFRSNTFFGGFEYILGGFEYAHNFKRLLKYEPNCYYVEHRPPILSTEKVSNPIHISGIEMATSYGVEMYHYSYVFAKQVKDKIQYYKNAVSLHNCMDNYFEKIWLQWVLYPEKRNEIENRYNGVHEFIPSYRGECKTMKFNGTHPIPINNSMDELKAMFDNQIKEYAIKFSYQRICY